MLKQLRELQGKAIGSLKNKKGQGLVEYALILVLIAVVVIAAVQSVGRSASTVYTNINTALK